LAWSLGVKGLGPISGFLPITSEDSWLLTQQIGPTSKCKAALRSFYFVGEQKSVVLL